MNRYKAFDHTADLGIEVYGATVEELFTNAAFAVFDMLTDLDGVRAIEERSITVEGEGWEDLLVNYLREVLYLFNGEGFLLKEFSLMEIEPHHLKGKVSGEMFDPLQHTINKEIKAVTYHQIMVRETPMRWEGRVIFDV
ncbi:MAG: archease [Syntrophaceae bacterium]|jgi:SHS2 domain-containing protein|nr:archease [Syntrophaceae bacterium]